MKLSVSNIAWNNNELEDHLALLRSLGCAGVEIAPSCIWKEPVDVSMDEIENLKKLVKRYNLEIPALQALLYTRPDLYLFGEKEVRREAVSYLKQLIRLAGRLSVDVLVFGSPASRRVEDKNYDYCYGISVDVFKELACEAELCSTIFCIEPLAPNESDFIQTAEEGYRLVREVDCPHFGLHLDARAMIGSGENFRKVFAKYAREIRHFHVGDPGLAPPGFTGIDHSPIGKALADSSYQGFVSIEMKTGFGESRDVVENAVHYVQDKYFGKVIA